MQNQLAWFVIGYAHKEIYEKSIFQFLPCSDLEIEITKHQ